jgi:hypothetical protein
METIAEELQSITVHEPSYFGGLTLFPLLRHSPQPPEPEYSLLEEAVVHGAARITEVNEMGSVPELLFENLGEKPVLLLDGEELIGAKQNRVVNLTILAPAKQAIAIPVSCVEAGRWHAQTAEFGTANHLMYSRARAAKSAQVSRSMAASESRESAQHAIWDEIASKSRRLGTVSPTLAMQAIYDSRAVAIDAYLRACAWAECQSGVIFAIGPETMGLDLMDHPHTMRAVLPKLIRSYALDALESPQAPALGISEATEFLERLSTAQSLVKPAVGMGEDWRLTGENVSGAALWAEHRYVHLCAFTTNGTNQSAEFRTRMSRPGRRRSH